ncbi:MAG TPA: methyltransferase domain-containing protein [Rhodocyclaceae bacterium]|nr:methyltransferase domain-containing protein [Rhodocyclaceae bacterium]
MTEPIATAAPSAWVSRFAPLIPAGGDVLDLACGGGRHARLLAALGYRVEAVDRDEQLLAGLSGVDGVTTRVADLEGGPWPYFGRAFDGIVVTNFLWRPLLPQLFACLGEGGVLIYETFMAGNERFGKPSHPEYLLRQGELLDLMHKRFTVVAFEQGEVQQPRPAVVQRICACRRREVTLPESAAPMR